VGESRAWVGAPQQVLAAGNQDVQVQVWVPPVRETISVILVRDRECVGLEQSFDRQRGEA
jgi:hypothetical protein